MLTEDFVKRIETLLDYFSITTAAFADKIGVQRSGISHLLSGRNKPSLDFILKIQSAFPEVNLYWLLNGEGNIILGENATASPSTREENLKKNEMTKSKSEKKEIQQHVEKIVVLYKDGTFREYLSRPNDIY